MVGVFGAERRVAARGTDHHPDLAEPAGEPRECHPGLKETDVTRALGDDPSPAHCKQGVGSGGVSSC